MHTGLTNGPSFYQIRRPRPGFTIIEILIAIALVALTSALVVTSYIGIGEMLENRPLPVIFREVVHEARYQAYVTKSPVHLRWDSQLMSFQLSSPEGALGEVILSDQARRAQPEGTEVEFYAEVSPLENTRNASDPQYTDEPVDYLVFHPSGMATPCEVLIRDNFGVFTITLEAFSSGPIDRERDQIQ